VLDGTEVDVSNFVNNNIAQDITIGADTFTNGGTLSCSSNGDLQVGGNWSNTGTILAADDTCEIDLGGTFTTAGIGTLITNGASVDITGSLDNTNATLNPGSYGGQWSLEGTLNGGTLDTSGGNVELDYGTLNGVHVTGGDLEIGDGAQVQIQNGITIDDHNLDIGSGAQVIFDGPGQTIDNLNIVPAGYAYLYPSGDDSSGPQTLTLGSNVTVHDGVTFRSQQVGDGLVNDGTLIADNAVGIGIDVDVDNFTNNGLAEASNSGTLTIEPTTSFTNAGILALQNGTIRATGGISLGSGKLIGSGAVIGEVTVASGSTISPGTSTVLGTGATDSIGSLSTSAAAFSGGGTYFWKIARPGTGGVPRGSGGSGTLGGGSGIEGSDWDQILTGSLSIAAGGSNPSFKIALNNTMPITLSGNTYSWVIAQTGSTSLPTFAGATNPYAAGTNLLLYSPTSTGNDVVVLDTSAYTVNGKTAPLTSNFSVEFEPIASDGGDYALVLDEAAPAPEPAVGVLSLLALPLLRRRRSARQRA
jgi:MYXO-CTERM domain-containing protein